MSIVSQIKNFEKLSIRFSSTAIKSMVGILLVLILVEGIAISAEHDALRWIRHHSWIELKDKNNQNPALQKIKLSAMKPMPHRLSLLLFAENEDAAKKTNFWSEWLDLDLLRPVRKDPFIELDGFKSALELDVIVSFIELLKASHEATFIVDPLRIGANDYLGEQSLDSLSIRVEVGRNESKITKRITAKEILKKYKVLARSKFGLLKSWSQSIARNQGGCDRQIIESTFNNLVGDFLKNKSYLSKLEEAFETLQEDFERHRKVRIDVGMPKFTQDRLNKLKSDLILKVDDFKKALEHGVEQKLVHVAYYRAFVLRLEDLFEASREYMVQPMIERFVWSIDAKGDASVPAGPAYRLFSFDEIEALRRVNPPYLLASSSSDCSEFLDGATPNALSENDGFSVRRASSKIH